MAPMLPIELLQSLSRSVPCREHQLGELATLYNVSFQSLAEKFVFLSDQQHRRTAFLPHQSSSSTASMQLGRVLLSKRC